MCCKRTGSTFVPLIEMCGDDALSVTIEAPDKRRSAAAHLREFDIWRECVEGMQSVVVQFDTAAISIDAASEQLRQQLEAATSQVTTQSSLIEIPVCYGGEFGPELGSICEMLGLAVDELIELHTSREYCVDLLGFTPGFAYVGGLADELDVPRLTEPRQLVPAGSVGIAGGRTGLYALAGPGGWPLIGRTPMALFVSAEKQPFLLLAGVRIRFTAIDEKTYRRMVMK